MVTKEYETGNSYALHNTGVEADLPPLIGLNNGFSVHDHTNFNSPCYINTV